ncbi:origin recognition complex subunit orc5 [Stemphylium lycopersici]|uniref:Origin recognition complex subunit orc5 n=1 Tax=Stemphylium lycopersici TaxID=183478 RepID=A0A364N8F8_STELY|nr:origin recognition complex subunit orc5 [Stemphylium lycopersici]RAR04201.1 origin recognition complex subunit orc5 [Stemphylium lycopersici]RAR13453.1 origin recognition complex subunit orc5 [Stemphylium lycopersici]
MLPDEIIAQLDAEYQCRHQQIQHLAALYSAHLPSPSLLNIHGLTATGKSSILRSYFHLSSTCHSIINVRECITTRHLVERIVASSLDALDEFHDEKSDRRPYARTENLSALCVNMGKLLEGRGKFVLVLDAMDKLREGAGTLIAALGRLGEIIPSLSIIITTTLPLTPSVLHSSSTSFLHFPSYTRAELLAILGLSPPKIFLEPPSLEHFPDYTPDLAAEDDAWLWGRFIQALQELRNATMASIR